MHNEFTPNISRSQNIQHTKNYSVTRFTSDQQIACTNIPIHKKRDLLRSGLLVLVPTIINESCNNGSFEARFTEREMVRKFCFSKIKLLYLE